MGGKGCGMDRLKWQGTAHQGVLEEKTQRGKSYFPSWEVCTEHILFALFNVYIMHIHFLTYIQLCETYLLRRESKVGIYSCRYLTFLQKLWIVSFIATCDKELHQYSCKWRWYARLIKEISLFLHVIYTACQLIQLSLVTLKCNRSKFCQCATMKRQFNADCSCDNICARK